MATPSWRSSRRLSGPTLARRFTSYWTTFRPHTTPEVKEWLEKNPNVEFHFTPVGSSWLNQIETWFGNITRQAIRRGTFSSVKVLIRRINGYITHWNSNAE